MQFERKKRRVERGNRKTELLNDTNIEIGKERKNESERERGLKRRFLKELKAFKEYNSKH